MSVRLTRLCTCAGEYASKGRQAAGETYDQAAGKAGSSVDSMRAALDSYSTWLQDIMHDVKTSSSRSAQVRHCFPFGQGTASRAVCMLPSWTACWYADHHSRQAGRQSVALAACISTPGAAEGDSVISGMLCEADLPPDPATYESAVTCPIQQPQSCNRPSRPLLQPGERTIPVLPHHEVHLPELKIHACRMLQPTARTAWAAAGSTASPPTSRLRRPCQKSWARGARPATLCTIARRATAASCGPPCRTSTTQAALPTARLWLATGRGASQLDCLAHQS